MAGTSNSGRKKLPTELKKLQGTFRAYRENQNTPTPELSTKVEAPEYLSELAKREYEAAAELLVSLGILREGDEAFLEIYADARARWIEAVQKLNESSSVYQTNKGELKVNPYIRVANKYAEIMKIYGSEFGLSPVARTKIEVEKKREEQNEFDAVSDCKVLSFRQEATG